MLKKILLLELLPYQRMFAKDAMEGAEGDIPSVSTWCHAWPRCDAQDEGQASQGEGVWGHDAADGEEYGRKSPLAPRREGWMVKLSWSWEYCTNLLACSRCLYQGGCGSAWLGSLLPPKSYARDVPNSPGARATAGGSQAEAQARGRRWPSSGCIFCLQF